LKFGAGCESKGAGNEPPLRSRPPRSGSPSITKAMRVPVVRSGWSRCVGAVHRRSMVRARTLNSAPPIR